MCSLQRSWLAVSLIGARLHLIFQSASSTPFDFPVGADLSDGNLLSILILRTGPRWCSDTWIYIYVLVLMRDCSCMRYTLSCSLLDLLWSLMVTPLNFLWDLGTWFLKVISSLTSLWEGSQKTKAICYILAFHGMGSKVTWSMCISMGDLLTTLRILDQRPRRLGPRTAKGRTVMNTTSQGPLMLSLVGVLHNTQLYVCSTLMSVQYSSI